MVKHFQSNRVNVIKIIIHHIVLTGPLTVLLWPICRTRKLRLMPQTFQLIFVFFIRWGFVVLSLFIYWPEWKEKRQGEGKREGGEWKRSKAKESVAQRKMEWKGQSRVSSVSCFISPKVTLARSKAGLRQLIATAFWHSLYPHECKDRVTEDIAGLLPTCINQKLDLKQNWHLSWH